MCIEDVEFCLFPVRNTSGALVRSLESGVAEEQTGTCTGCESALILESQVSVGISGIGRVLRDLFVPREQCGSA